MKYNNYYWVGTDKDIECKVSTKPHKMVYDSYKFIPNKKYELYIDKFVNVRYMDISVYSGKHPYRETCINSEKKFIVSTTEHMLYYQNYGYLEAKLSFSKHKELMPDCIEQYSYYIITSTKFDIYNIGDININHFITEDEWRNKQINKILNKND